MSGQTTPSVELMDLLGELYELDEIRTWLSAPQPLFQGETPRDMIAAGREAELIRALNALLDGAYI